MYRARARARRGPVSFTGFRGTFSQAIPLPPYSPLRQAAPENAVRLRDRGTPSNYQTPVVPGLASVILISSPYTNCVTIIPKFIGIYFRTHRDNGVTGCNGGGGGEI